MMPSLAVICTRGFGDLLPLARQNRPDPYTLHVPASPWLTWLPKPWRIEAGGRIDADGREVEPLTPGDLDAVLAALKALPNVPSAVAIGLLFAFRNPRHEQALAGRIAATFPGITIACSHRVPRRAGQHEYERLLDTVASVDPDGWLRGPPLAAPAPQAAPARTCTDVVARLAGIADQMQQRLIDEAVSSVVREAMDCAAAVFLPDGRMIAEARTLPLLTGSLSSAVAGMIAAFPITSMADGDGYLLNDPWHGGTHLPDLVLMRPVCHAGRVRALAACVLHHQDVGGIAPGSVPTHAQDIHQEGLRIPPLRLYQQGAIDPALLRLLMANSRMPVNLEGDLAAQWHGLCQGSQAIAACIAALGDSGPDRDAFDIACHDALAAREAAVRAAIAAAPDGDYDITDALDGDGITVTPVPIAVRLRKRGDRMTIDLTACAAQTAGPVNASPGAVRAAIAYFARMLAPDQESHRAGNDGGLAPLQVETRPGTVVDPRLPAAVNARTNLVKLLANALLAAWGQAQPNRMPAPNAAEAVVLSLGGVRSDGRSWLFTEIIASAAGGAPWGPGGSGVSTDVGNARNTPAEVIEAQAPIRVERVAIRAGSGGDGLHRGGDGVVRVYRLLSGRGTLSYRGERHQIAPQGLAGGQPGACASARLERADGQVEILPAKARVHWQAGDRLVIETAGAGGWGRPAAASDPAAAPSSIPLQE